MLPNATAILSSLPSGLRAVVSRVDDGVVATLAVRTALHESGTLSLGGLDRQTKTNVWTLAADFAERVAVGDTLRVDGTPAIVVDAMLTAGGLVSRAGVVLCEDSVTVGDIDIPCQLGLLGEDIATSLGGFLPEDTQGFFVPALLVPEGVDIAEATPVMIAGVQMAVEKVSRDSRHGILCVTCKKRGAV